MNGKGEGLVIKLPDFMKLLQSAEYDFLRTNEHLGPRIMLLGLSGSYGYVTNWEGSDVDFRGIALQQPSDILGLTEFEQYVDDHTDTIGHRDLCRCAIPASFSVRLQQNDGNLISYCA